VFTDVKEEGVECVPGTCFLSFAGAGSLHTSVIREESCFSFCDVRTAYVTRTCPQPHFAIQPMADCVDTWLQ
jgi:hypothetical protein